MNDRCSDPNCQSCKSEPIRISVGVYPRPLLSLPALIAIIVALAFAVGLAVSGCADGSATTADSPPAWDLPRAPCGDMTGYTHQAIDCGGATAGGYRCARACAWVSETDAGVIPNATGCTLTVSGEAAVCVLNCSDCQ